MAVVRERAYEVILAPWVASTKSAYQPTDAPASRARSPLVSLTKHLNTPEAHLRFPIDFSAVHSFPRPATDFPAFDKPDVLLSSQRFRASLSPDHHRPPIETSNR